MTMEPLRDSQGLEPGMNCPKCGGEVWPGEEMYRVDGKELCEDCFKGWFWDFWDTSPRRFALVLGCEAVTVGEREMGEGEGT